MQKSYSVLCPRCGGSRWKSSIWEDKLLIYHCQSPGCEYTRSKPKSDIMTDEIKQALKIAADALDIAADWNVSDVQVNPPPEWKLQAYEENAADGWCSIRELAQKLRELAELNKATSYEAAYREAWQSILRTAINLLGHDDPVAGKAAWIIERGKVIDRLRSACADFGDNDWPDELVLEDVIDKHLVRHLHGEPLE